MRPRGAECVSETTNTNATTQSAKSRRSPSDSGGGEFSVSKPSDRRLRRAKGREPCPHAGQNRADARIAALDTTRGGIALRSCLRRPAALPAGASASSREVPPKPTASNYMFSSSLRLLWGDASGMMCTLGVNGIGYQPRPSSVLAPARATESTQGGPGKQLFCLAGFVRVIIGSQRAPVLYGYTNVMRSTRVLVHKTGGTRPTAHPSGRALARRARARAAPMHWSGVIAVQNRDY